MPYFRLLLFIFVLCSQLASYAAIEPFVVASITLNTHKLLNLKEFIYLTEIEPGMVVTEEKLEQAKQMIMLKKRFSDVQFTVTPHPHSKLAQLVCTATPLCLLKKVSVRGILMHKQPYLNAYKLQEGDQFSQTTHNESLEEITKVLHSQGFLSGHVSSTISYNDRDQTAFVKLWITQGPHFNINHINCMIETPDQVVKRTLYKKIQLILNPWVKQYRYKKRLIDAWTNQIKTILIHEGFFRSMVRSKLIINHEQRTVSVIFFVIPSRQRFSFEGNHHASNSELLRVLIDGIGPAWLIKPEIIRQQIVAYYQSHGFWRIAVKIKKDVNNYTINLNEGKRIHIDSCLVVDENDNPIHHISPTVLSGLRGTLCTTRTIEQKTEQLISYFVRHGYWDCGKINTRVMATRNSNTCKIIFKINLGSQRINHSTLITCPELELPQSLIEKLNRHRGSLYDPAYLAEQKQLLISHFHKKGYWYASLDCDLANLPTKNSSITPVQAIWKINLGSQVSFGKLIVQGCTKLPFERILRHCNFTTGMPWEAEKLKSSRAKLYQLGTFSQVQLAPHNLSEKSATKHVVTTLFDDDPYEIRLKFGAFFARGKPFLAENFMIRAGGTYLIKNPLNRADILSLFFQFDRTEQHVGTSYQIPDLVGSNRLDSLTLCAGDYHFMLNLTEQTEAMLVRKHEITVSSKPYSAFGEQQIGWTAGISSGSIISMYGNLNFDQTGLGKHQPFVFCEPSYYQSTIDENTVLAEGGTTIGRLKISLPLVKEITFPLIKGIIQQKYARKIGRKLGIAFNFQCGHMWGQTFSKILPYERFLLGGAESIRGYAKDTLPPLGQYTTHDGSLGYTIQGGKTMVQTNLELKYKVANNLEFIVFHDAGSLAQESPREILHNWFRTIGIGTRLYTPIGTAKFDLGWKQRLSYADEYSYHWHLTFGGSF